MTLNLGRLAQGGIRRQTQPRLQCDKDDLTWAIRNGVYGGGNNRNKQRCEAEHASYQLTVRWSGRCALRKFFGLSPFP